MNHYQQKFQINKKIKSNWENTISQINQNLQNPKLFDKINQKKLMLYILWDNTRPKP